MLPTSLPSRVSGVATEQDPNETDNGFKYESVQFGLNGASVFARLSHKF